MTADRHRLDQLLDRLRQCEGHPPLPHERAIREVAMAALRDEISRVTHRLYDLSYCLPTGDAPVGRVA